MFSLFISKYILISFMISSLTHGLLRNMYLHLQLFGTLLESMLLLFSNLLPLLESIFYKISYDSYCTSYSQYVVNLVSLPCALEKKMLLGVMLLKCLVKLVDSIQFFFNFYLYTFCDFFFSSLVT